MGCMICGNRGSGAVCPRCGYDESQDREQYPTLADDGKRPPANMALRDALFTSMAEQIAAAKLGDSPTVQTPTKRQSAQQQTRINHASKILASGTCGSQLTWNLGKDGTLTISGNGQMDDWVLKSPWRKYAKTISALSLPDGIENIGNCAFSNCENLTNVTIPDGVTRIGIDAFSKCFALTSITIPGSVTSIGDGVFYGCSSLTSITLPNSVTSIGFDTFYGCNSLTSVIVPDSVTDIEDYAFSRCTALERVRIPKSVQRIGDWVFEKCPRVEIWGEASSAAESFAHQKRIPFHNLNTEQLKAP